MTDNQMNLRLMPGAGRLTVQGNEQENRFFEAYMSRREEVYRHIAYFPPNTVCVDCNEFADATLFLNPMGFYFSNIRLHCHGNVLLDQAHQFLRQLNYMYINGLVPPSADVRIFVLISAMRDILSRGNTIYNDATLAKFVILNCDHPCMLEFLCFVDINFNWSSDDLYLTFTIYLCLFCCDDYGIFRTEGMNLMHVWCDLMDNFHSNPSLPKYLYRDYMCSVLLSYYMGDNDDLFSASLEEWYRGSDVTSFAVYTAPVTRIVFSPRIRNYNREDSMGGNDPGPVSFISDGKVFEAMRPDLYHIGLVSGMFYPQLVCDGERNRFTLYGGSGRLRCMLKRYAFQPPHVDKCKWEAKILMRYVMYSIDKYVPASIDLDRVRNFCISTGDEEIIAAMFGSSDLAKDWHFSSYYFPEGFSVHDSPLGRSVRSWLRKADQSQFDSFRVAYTTRRAVLQDDCESNLKFVFGTEEWRRALNSAPMLKHFATLVMHAHILSHLLMDKKFDLAFELLVSDMINMSPTLINKTLLLLGLATDTTLESAVDADPSFLSRALSSLKKLFVKGMEDVSSVASHGLAEEGDDEESKADIDDEEYLGHGDGSFQNKASRGFYSKLPILALAAAIFSEAMNITGPQTVLLMPFKTLKGVSSSGHIFEDLKSMLGVMRFRYENFLSSGKFVDLLCSSPRERFVMKSKVAYACSNEKAAIALQSIDPATMLEKYEELDSLYEKLEPQARKDEEVKNWRYTNVQLQEHYAVVVKGGKKREQPFSILYTGLPGVGKTSRFTSDAKCANQEFFKGLRNFDPADIYVYETTEKHQNGCERPLCFVLNDFKTDGLSKGVDADVAMLIQRIVDVAPFRVEKADLDGKSKPYIDPKLFILTTNETLLDFAAFGNDHSRLARRFNYTCEMRLPRRLSHYKDISVAITAEGEKILEEVEYHIYQPLVKGSKLYAIPPAFELQSGKVRKLGVYVGETAYTKFMVSAMNEHYDRQRRISALETCTYGISWHNHKEKCMEHCNWEPDEDKPTFNRPPPVVPMPVIVEEDEDLGDPEEKEEEEIEYIPLLSSFQGNKCLKPSMTSLPARIKKESAKKMSAFIHSTIDKKVDKYTARAMVYIRRWLKIGFVLGSVYFVTRTLVRRSKYYSEVGNRPINAAWVRNRLAYSKTLNSDLEEKERSFIHASVKAFGGPNWEDILREGGYDFQSYKEIEYATSSKTPPPAIKHAYTNMRVSLDKDSKNKCIDFESLRGIAAKNTFRAVDASKAFIGHVIALTGDVYLGQGHVLKHCKYIEINHGYYVFGNMQRIKGTEYVTIQVKYYHKGLLEFWLEDCPSSFEGATPHGDVIVYNQDEITDSIAAGYKIKRIDARIGVGSTRGGDCGTPYVVKFDNGNGAGIAGLHLLYWEAVQEHGFEVISKSVLVKHLDTFKHATFAEDMGYAKLQSADVSDKRNPWKYHTDNFALNPLPIRDPSNASTGASKITINPEFSDLRGKFGIPDLKHRKVTGPDGTLYHSASHKLVKMENTPEFAPDSELLRKAGNDFFGKVPDKEVLAPFSRDTIIYGGEGVAKLNWSTSSGSNPKTRKQLFENQLDEMLACDIDRTIKQLSTGVIASYKKCNYKDEVLAQSKIDVAKYRIFMAAELPFLVVCKMFLMPIVEYMYARRSYYECMGHFNATSPEYREMYHVLQEGKPLGYLFGDFSGMDSSLFPMIVEEVAYQIELMCLELGYVPIAARITGNCIRSSIYSFLSLEGFLAYVEKGMASGEFFTYWLNCVVVSIIYRYCFYMFKTALERNDFRSYVTLRTGGDDSAASSRTDSVNMHNMQTAAACLGYVYTDSQKRSEFPRFSDISEFEFFKRTPVVIDGLVYGALSKSSIEKSLAFYKGGGFSRIEVLSDAIDAASREFALHGREEYDRFKNYIISKNLPFRYRFIPFEVTISRHDSAELEVYDIDDPIHMS